MSGSKDDKDPVRIKMEQVAVRLQGKGAFENIG